MKQARIIRIDATPDNGTLGVFLVDGVAQCVTLEPYHRGNEKGISSIPTGQYYCKPYSSLKYPDTWEITEVISRTKVLFHTGNLDQNTKGCVILGSEYGRLGGEYGVLESRKAFNRVRNTISTKETFKLTIVDCY